MPAPTENNDHREPSEVLYRGCLSLGGIAMAVTFAALAGWTIWQLIAVGFSALNLLLVAFFGVMALVGGLVSRAGLRSKKTTKASAGVTGGGRQRGVLRTAQKYDGRVTLAEIALETRLDVNDARGILEEFELHGIAEMQISDSGREVYVFPGFVDGGIDKETARSILDEDREVELLFEELAELEEQQGQDDEQRAEVSAVAKAKNSGQD